MKHLNTWTMVEADRAFGGPDALTDALRALHGALTRLAPQHGGVAMCFNDVGEPTVGPTIGQGPFLPGTHQDGEGRVYHGWLKGASAHAKLQCAAGFQAARALWAIVEAFYPDLHPIDVPAFAVVGGVEDPRLVVTSGPLRTGPAGETWSVVDVEMPLAEQVATLWNAAIRASQSDQRFLTGHQATTLRATDAADLHHVLHATGHATAWVVHEPLRIDGVARRLDKGPIGWSQTEVHDRVRATQSALEAVIHQLHTDKPDANGFAVWYGQDGHVQQSFAEANRVRRAIPQPVGGLAKRALRRLVDTNPLFGHDGRVWGAQPRLAWTKNLPAQRWHVQAHAAGMVFDGGPTWSGDTKATNLRHLDPWVARTSHDPWWVAYHHQDGKRGQPRLFQAPDLEAATERCIVACRHTVDQRNGWTPFHHRQLLLWPVERPSVPQPTSTQDT